MSDELVIDELVIEGGRGKFFPGQAIVVDVPRPWYARLWRWARRKKPQKLIVIATGGGGLAARRAPDSR